MKGRLWIDADGVLVSVVFYEGGWLGFWGDQSLCNSFGSACGLQWVEISIKSAKVIQQFSRSIKASNLLKLQAYCS